MSVIRVGSGKRRVPLGQALAQARPGDTLQLDEEVHPLPAGAVLSNVELVGVGDRARTVIQAQLAPRANCRLVNLTVQAPHFHNAIWCGHAGSTLWLDGVTLLGDPGRKYPAAYLKGTTAYLSGVMIHTDGDQHGVDVCAGATVDVRASSIGGLRVEKSTATLVDSSLFRVYAAAGARVHAHGTLDLYCPTGKYALYLEGESALTADAVRSREGEHLAFASDSYLEIRSLHVAGEETFTVRHEDRATVRVPSSVTVVDLQAKPAPRPAQDVVWDPADAHRFKEAVAPRLEVGDTLVLREGDYYLDDYENHTLVLAVDVRGEGDPDRIVVHGRLQPRPGTSVTFTGFTVAPPTGQNAVGVYPGGVLHLTDVTLLSEDSFEYPAVYVEGGRLTLTACTVALYEAEAGRILACEGAHVEARDTWLGWLRVRDRSTVAVHGGGAHQVMAWDGAEVTGHGEVLLTSNDQAQRTVVVQGGARVAFDRLVLEGGYLEQFVEESELTIRECEAQEGAETTVFVGAEAVLDVPEHLAVVDAAAYAEAAETADEPEEEDTDAPVGAAEDDLAAGHEEEDDPDGETEDGDPRAELLALTGLAQVKEQITEFVQVVEFNQLRKARGQKTTQQTMHSLFLGNPGTGKTTVARLLGKILYAAGAVEKDTFVEVQRRDLVGQTIGSSAHLTQAVLKKARGGVLFIDEAYSLYQENNNQFGQEAVDTLLTFMENHRDEIVVIFAGYTDKMQDFLQMNPGLRSRVPNRFDFEDYSPDEIAEIGYRALVDNDYLVDEALYRRVVANKYRSASDRSNGRWVRNFNQTLTTAMAKRVVTAARANPELADGDFMQTITDEDVYSLVGGDARSKDEAVESLLAELDAMIGLAPVKAWVRELVAEAKANRRLLETDASLERPTYHMVFTGNPGTGKTTVARIIGQIFHNLGILDSPTVKEVDRSALVGQWIGHTERQTSNVIEEALGGVLFVDEAYQLYVADSERDFGRAAIETFMTRLENDRDKFVAIFAGYTHNMEQFLSANPGLRSRIPLTLEFPDYSPAEVAQIVVARLRNAWTFDEALVAEVAERAYAAAAPADRSNGRWARNFAQQIEKAHKRWLVDADVDAAQIRVIRDEVVRGVG